MNKKYFSYEIVVADTSYSFTWRVYVYYQNRQIDDSFAMTRWGAKMRAKEIMRRHINRDKLRKKTPISIKETF